MHSSTLSVQGSFGLVFVSRSLSHETAVACVPRSCGHGLADLRPVVDESSGSAGCAGAEQPGEDTDTDWEHALNTMLGGTLGGPRAEPLPGPPGSSCLLNFYKAKRGGFPALHVFQAFRCPALSCSCPAPVLRFPALHVFQAFRCPALSCSCPALVLRSTFTRRPRGKPTAFCVAQKRKGTLPRLSQTGEGFLFGFDFHII